MEFWFFWIVHLQIVGAAAYDLSVRRYRPSTRDWAVAAACSMAYVAFIVPFNVAMGTQYGWLGQGQYRTRNVIDLLGPWPQRPILLVLIGQLVVAGLWAVWHLPRRHGKMECGAAVPAAERAGRLSHTPSTHPSLGARHGETVEA
jgi:uncharacterized membrane protein YwaF